MIRTIATEEYVVQYSTSASNALLLLMLLLYAPLMCVALLISIDLVTGTVFMLLLIALASGLLRMRFNVPKESGILSISPGDLLIQGHRRQILSIPPLGLKTLDERTLECASGILFQTKLFFRSEKQCSQALATIHSSAKEDWPLQ